MLKKGLLAFFKTSEEAIGMSLHLIATEEVRYLERWRRQSNLSKEYKSRNQLRLPS